MLGAFLFGSGCTLSLFFGWLCMFGRRVWGDLFCCRALLWGGLPFGRLGLLRRCPRLRWGCLFRVQRTCWLLIAINPGGLRFVFRLSHVFPGWILPLLLLLLAELFLLRLRMVVSSFTPITLTFGENVFKYVACHNLWRVSRRAAATKYFTETPSYSPF